MNEETLPHEEKPHGAERKTRIFALDRQVSPGFTRKHNFFLIIHSFDYIDAPGSLFSKEVRTDFIYTLGATEEMMEERGFDKPILANVMLMKKIFGASETLCSYETSQFEDYSKVYAPRFDSAKKAKVRGEVFPIDCEKAFKMGARFVGELR